MNFTRSCLLSLLLLLGCTLTHATEITATFASQPVSGTFLVNNGATPVAFTDVPYSVVVTYNTENVVSLAPFDNYFRVVPDSAFWTLGPIGDTYAAQTQQMDASQLVLDRYSFTSFTIGFFDNIFYDHALATAYFPSYTSPLSLSAPLLNVPIAGGAPYSSDGRTFLSLSGVSFQYPGGQGQNYGTLSLTFTTTSDPAPTPTPEPSTIALMGLPLIVLGAFKCPRRTK